jgi:two-component system, OmpR family, sensor kinase
VGRFSLVRWVRGQAIRSRITIWSVLIAAGLIAVAAFGFLGSVESIVSASTRALLDSDGASYEASIQRGVTNQFSSPGEQQLIAVVDPSGVVRLSNLPESLDKRLSALEKLSDDGLHSVQGGHGVRYYVTVENVLAPASENGTPQVWRIVAARNSASGAVVLDGVSDALIGAWVALVVAFGASAWLVTGLALRPVMRMRRQASMLSQSTSADTLPVGPVHDELSALAETLNEFITSVRASTDRERQMVADASHELRTPIAVLKTQLQLAHLSRGDATALEKEIVAAELTLERLSNLTTNLLTLSRIEAADSPGQAPHSSGEVILAEFLSSMDRAIVLGSASGVNVDFTTDGVEPDAQVPLLPVDFAGLVDNLVSNAIAASQRGSSVAVDLARRGNLLVLTVLDSGHGITADFLAVAFDRFSRPVSSRGRGVGGNGLGLAIVKAIVTRSGGDVRLEQRREGGVRATVELPVTV